MHKFFVAVASAVPAVLLSWAAHAAEQPSGAPVAVQPPPPAYAPPPYAYWPPVQYEAPPAPEPYDVRYPKKSAGIFISPLSILTGTFGAELDLKMTSAVALDLGANYTSAAMRTFDRNSTSADAWSIDVGPQIFPLGRAFNQLYVYPRFAYARAWTAQADPAVPDSSATATAFGFITTVGYQWTYESGFSLRLGAGFGYYAAHAEDDKSTTQIQVAGLLPALDASLGWTF